MGEPNSANGAMLSPRATQIQTAGGRFVDLLSPDPAMLSVLDIGRHLSRICRYGGALSDDIEYYSVAEHCVLVHDLMRWQGARGGELLGALMHDAAEAYLGDLVSPLKYALRHRELVRVGGFAGELPNGGELPAGVHWDGGLLPSEAYTRWTESLGALCGGEVLFETPSDMGAR